MGPFGPLVSIKGHTNLFRGSIEAFKEQRGTILAKGSPWWSVGGPYMIKWAHRDLIRSTQDSIRDTYWALGIHIGMNSGLFSDILWSFILLHHHVFLHNFFNFSSKLKILVIFQQRTEWAGRKHMIFLTRVLRKFRYHTGHPVYEHIPGHWCFWPLLSLANILSLFIWICTR